MLAQNSLRLLVCADTSITVSLGYPTSISPQRSEQPEVMPTKLSEAEDTKEEALGSLASADFFPFPR